MFCFPGGARLRPDPWIMVEIPAGIHTTPANQATRPAEIRDATQVRGVCITEADQKFQGSAIFQALAEEPIRQKMPQDGSRG